MSLGSTGLFTEDSIFVSPEAAFEKIADTHWQIFQDYNRRMESTGGPGGGQKTKIPSLPNLLPYDWTSAERDHSIFKVRILFGDSRLLTLGSRIAVGFRDVDFVNFHQRVELRRFQDVADIFRRVVEMHGDILFGN